MANVKKLKLWQERLSKNESAYSGELSKMDKRERLYRGERSGTGLTKEDKNFETPHVRNICAEIIEAQVDSTIPKPKVTPKRKEDEDLAKLIEDMLINEMNRLPFESINDMLMRTVPIQGGAGFLVEWDNDVHTHTTVGELSICDVHPKQIIPQDGVYKSVEDMDYIILKLPQTKGAIKRRYGVDVESESEKEPDIKGVDGSSAEDMVTQYIAYYRNDKGGIGLYSWVCDTELVDNENYQARRLKKCVKCGGIKYDREVMAHIPPTYDGNYPSVEDESEIELITDKDVCPYCRSKKWEYVYQDFEEVRIPIKRSDGSDIPGEVSVERDTVDIFGLPTKETVTEPTKIPFYTPDIYPVILIKNVSVFGKFLGDSDIDKVADAQNTTNRIEKKIIEKIIAGGSYMTLPPDATIEKNSEEMKLIHVTDPAKKALVGVYDMEGNIQQDVAYLSQVYEESRQAIGITDSFQGRVDRTATSGKAKEFAAAQSAGRLESKRVMKEAAFAQLFEAMFKFKLAYTDEPRPVISSDIHGNSVYEEFNRYDFLKKDDAGEWYWNDDFLFSCDSTAPLASNREAMWQETRLNFQSGTFGNPQDIKTLILFWTKMEQLHYPTASETKRYLEEEYNKQLEAQQMEQQNQIQLQQMQQMQTENSQNFDGNMARNVIAEARAAAERDALNKYRNAGAEGGGM